MSPMSVLAAIVRRVGRNLAYNLDYVPDDRLNWKPAPTAKSALEIVNHTAYFLKAMTSVVADGGWREPQYTPAQDRASAKDLIAGSADAYVAALEVLTEQDLHRQAELPFGTFPLVQAASMCSVDLIHHHGQISYIQTLLGDTEDHFDPQVV